MVDGEYGTLTISPDGEYSYVRDADAPDGETDVFTYTLTDGDGDEDTATLTITIVNGSPTVDVPTGEEAATLGRRKGPAGAQRRARRFGRGAAAGADGDPASGPTARSPSPLATSRRR